MIEFHFEDGNGRRLRPDQVGSYVRQSFQKQLTGVLRKKGLKMAQEHRLTLVRCPKHLIGAKNWRLKAASPGSNRYNLAYDECCPALVKAINAAAPK